MIFDGQFSPRSSAACASQITGKAADLRVPLALLFSVYSSSDYPKNFLFGSLLLESDVLPTKATLSNWDRQAETACLTLKLNNRFWP